MLLSWIAKPRFSQFCSNSRCQFYVLLSPVCKPAARFPVCSGADGPRSQAQVRFALSELSTRGRVAPSSLHVKHDKPSEVSIGALSGRMLERNTLPHTLRRPSTELLDLGSEIAKTSNDL